MSETERLERRIEIIQWHHGAAIPGIQKIRDTLRPAGFGVGQDGAVELQNVMKARAGLPVSPAPVLAVNGSGTP